MEKLDYGVSIRIFGGQLSHIGAIAVVDQKGRLSSITLPGHKETVVREERVNAFYRQIREPVCVEAGIHYDDLTGEQLKYVVEQLTIMKCEILGRATDVE